MRAITVCVDYHDLLALTLPYNIHHFEEFWIVTSLQDVETYNLYERFRREGLPVRLVRTDSFYECGADFNKWIALERGLTAMGRHGWIAVLDADVLWPKKTLHWRLDVGCLYTPLRHMFADLRLLPAPEEKDWWRWPLHPQQSEWAGYTQVFHANDPVLNKLPWYQTNWRHAGGADSFFQQKWSKEKKLRPPFEVLHLGPSGENWCGRSSPYLNGTVEVQAKERQKELRKFLLDRRRQKLLRSADPYSHERL